MASGKKPPPFFPLPVPKHKGQVVRGHGDHLLQLEARIGGDGCHLIQLSQPPLTVAFPQGLVEGGIACTRVSAIAHEWAVNDQGCSAGQQQGGFLEQGIRAAGCTDVQQIDADDCAQ